LGPIESQIAALTANRADILAGRGEWSGSRLEDRELALKLQIETIRQLKTDALVAVGRPATKAATIGKRSVQVMYSREPWVCDKGCLNVRVRVLENGEYRGIGKLKVRDEHLRFVNPPVKVPTGEKRVERIDGADIERNVYEESPAAALEQIVLQALDVIGLSDNIERGIGNTTTTVYSDADDGALKYLASASTWASLIGQATATNVFSTNSSVAACTNDHSATTNLFDSVSRGSFPFDTSAIGSDTISSATLSAWPSLVESGSADDSADIVSHSRDTPGTLAAGDFDNYGSTLFGQIASMHGESTSAYSNFTLNAAGIAYINGSGTTVFGCRTGSDRTATTPTPWGGGNSGLRFYFSEQTGTTNDPKLTVEHSSGVAPVLASLVVSAFDESSIALAQPTFDTEGDPAPTVEAFIGLTGTISESGGVVSDYLEGEVDVSAGGYTFSGLKSLQSYTIYVVATNSEGYSVKSIAQKTGYAGSIRKLEQLGVI
jgi:hypothetical protein